jgi:hypothetical protein
MKIQKTLFSLLLFGLMGAGPLFAQPAQSGQTVTFRFVAGQDMFYIPWGGNDAELTRLYSLVDEYRAEIESGRMPVYVDGYSASMRDGKRNRELAFVRANRVKSELITNKGLREENFVTKNHASAYEGRNDMVVVTLRIPAKEQPRQPEPVREQPRPEPVVEPQPEPELPVVIDTPAKPYCFAIRTNLLYDAFLLPTLGVEWRASRSVGVKLDVSGSNWGDKHSNVQKMWLVSPEVRWYMGGAKRFYVGAGANFGESNIYKGMLGSLISKNIGYQGSFWNAGVTVGYQLRLNRSFSLDFNLGLGYTNFEYDSFNVTDGVRVINERNKTKDFWGPTQAGINLTWTIGNKK